MLPLAPPVSRTCLILACCLFLAACETYEPLPLDPAPHLVTDPAALDHGAVDPTAPLDAAGFTLLVLRNNPDLRAGRKDRDVAEAQVLQAGLLPNPQLSGNYGVLLGGPAQFDSWAAGFGEDIKSLV